MELFAQTTNIVPALIAARRAFKAAVKDSTNPHFKSKYVSLDGVIEAINDALLANGIFLTQTTYVQDAQTILRTMLLHTSGESIHGDYPVHPVKPDPQGEGSALTYARRYALMGLVGIAPEDDDGNAAVAAGRAPPKKVMSTQAIHEAGVHPTGGVLESLTATELDRAQKIAATALEYFEASDAAGAYAYLTERAFNEGDGADMKTAVKALFPKEYLKALKALSEQPTRRAA